MDYDRRPERYINPYTDFGFKKLFGTDMNKELLISFLNALFDGKEEVKDITYLNNIIPIVNAFYLFIDHLLPGILYFRHVSLF